MSAKNAFTNFDCIVSALIEFDYDDVEEYLVDFIKDNYFSSMASEDTPMWKLENYMTRLREYYN